MVQKIIPKEMIDKIMEEYACTKEQATQAFLEAQSNFEETLHEKLGMNLEEKTRAKEGPITLTPYEIKEYLDKFVIGQEVYKKRLAIAAAYHFAMVKAKTDKPDLIEEHSVKRFRKKNTLIAGASGSGKTYCVEVLADLMGVPVNVVDATDYTEAGYVGKSADDMIRELINIAPGENKREKAEFINRFGGLIFIDEMDKKAKEGNHVGVDVSREGFQRSVLKLIERKLVSIDDPNSPSSQIQELVDQQRGIKSSKKKSMISTENILFILGGSFQRPNDSMETIVKKRLDNKSGRVKEDGSLTISGFSVQDSESRRDTYRNYYKEAIEDDYIRFGIIPELVGRAPIRTYVNPLSKNDLVRIMTETEDSILNQYKLEFGLFGIKVNFTNEAIEYVATKAEKKKTGARALVSEWETILTDFQYTLPGTSFDTLKVDENICSHPQDQLLELFEKSPLFDFVSRFNKEFGIQIKFSEDAATYIEEYAKSHGIQVSVALDKLMSGAAALNYINLKGEYTIEKYMLEDEKFFDKMYVEWHKKQMDVQPE